MITHNLKIAWRNLMKYKMQNLVSAVALAVGMVTIAATHYVMKRYADPAITDEPYFNRTCVLKVYPINADREKLNSSRNIETERIKPEDFICVIEISKGSKKKYELDKETGLLKLDRVLYTSTHYPADYGFIPRTYADDGDPLDVLVLCSETIRPMSLVRCHPIGVITMLDGGKLDEKIIAVPVNDPNYNVYSDIDQLPAHRFDEIRHFFEVYKTLEHNKNTSVTEVKPRQVAEQIIEACMESYIHKFQM